MKQASLKSLWKQGVFSSPSMLRENTNGYLYITLIGQHGINNVYFGKTSAKTLLKTYKVGDDISKELGNATIILAINDGKEERYKISLQGDNEGYSSIGEMEEIFGTEQKGSLDIAGFIDEFETIESPKSKSKNPTPQFQTFTGTSTAPKDDDIIDDVTDEELEAEVKAEAEAEAVKLAKAEALKKRKAAMLAKAAGK